MRLMLLDVLTLLGILYILLTIVEYFYSLFKSPVQKQKASGPIQKSENPESLCYTVDQHPEQAKIKPKIQYIIMENELPDQDLGQYQSEILKRRKRIAAGEVKGFYMNTGNNDNELNKLESAIDQRHRSSYSTDITVESEMENGKLLSKDTTSYDVPHITSNNLIMVGLDAEQGYCTDVSLGDQRNTQIYRQRQFQQRDERRSSLDTIPVKLSAPITIIQSSNGTTIPFKISENSAFTPISPKRDASLERRPILLSATTTGSLHAQSVPDISLDSGVHTGPSTASSSSTVSTTTQAPVHITVVMRSTTGSSGGQKQTPQKVSSTFICTGTSQNKRTDESSPDTDSKLKQNQPESSPVKLPSFMDSEPKPLFADQSHTESDSVKLKLLQPSIDQTEDQIEKIKKPYMKSWTTGLASTAAMARAMASVNNKNNYYAKDQQTIGPYRKQPTPPPLPPNPTTEVMTHQLLKKQSTLADTYPRRTHHRPYVIDQPQMALTRAMRPIDQDKYGQRMSYGGTILNESIMPQPYHPPTMANYEHLPPSPRVITGDANRFVFDTKSSNFDSRQHRHERAGYSPNAQNSQYMNEHANGNVILKSNEHRPGLTISNADGNQRHSLSIDEGMAHERSRSRERSTTRHKPHPSYSFDENLQPQSVVPSNSYRTSFDDEKSVPREITDQGVPLNEDVLKGGNVSSKTKLFEALAEQEYQDADTQFQQQRKPLLSERWAPQVFATSTIPTSKHKKMERSHTVHTVRSLMAPDAYQYENAPRRSPYDQESYDPLSPRYKSTNKIPSPFYGAGKPTNESQLFQPTIVHIPPPQKEEIFEFPPASVSPRSVQKEHAVIGKGHQFHQAQVVQPQEQCPEPDSPQAHVQIQIQTQPVAAILAPFSKPAAPRSAALASSASMEHAETEFDSSPAQGNLFEDEMSKMSIADKAKLFEQKAEEQAQKKQRYTIRHKTQPVTTEEVMKARLVANEKLARRSEEQKAGRAHMEEAELEKHNTSNENTTPASRNVVIYQRAPSLRNSVNRLDEVQRDQEENENSSTATAPSVKPRRTVFLHSNEHNGHNSAQNDQIQRDQPGATRKRDLGEVDSDQNNNEKVTKCDTVTPSECTVVTSTLTHGSQNRNSPISRVIWPPIENQSYMKDNENSLITENAKIDRHDHSEVKEKKKTINDLNLRNIEKSNNSNGRLFSRILVNQDDEDDVPATRNRKYESINHQIYNLHGFCSKAQDLEYIQDGNEKVQDDSFTSIIETPVIRLQHFDRPKPRRRHSARANHTYESVQRFKNHIITIND